ncbi:MAG: hypothetical protein CMH57_02335 [Myxococcales bacterium]|nr:hypothetical protein [Myxococcales bacterium]
MSTYDFFFLGIIAAWLLPVLRWAAEQLIDQTQSVVPSVTILAHDRAFKAALRWLSENGRWASAIYRSTSGLSPGKGWAFGEFDGHPLVLHCELDQNDNGEETGSLRVFFPTALFEGRGIIHRWLEETTELPIAPEGLIPVWRYDYGEWDEMAPKRPRQSNTLFYPGRTKEDLVEALERFYASREACQERCEPWRVAFMLEGPPGTGKTSLIHYAASELRLGLALVSTRFLQHIRDSDLVKALGELPPGFLVVVEDIDRLFQASGDDDDDDKEPEVRNNKVELSELLNLLDGFHTPEGVVFMMTANHPELLPDALTRRMITVRVDLPSRTELEGFVETRRPGWGGAFIQALGEQRITIARVEQLLRMHPDNSAFLDATRALHAAE